MKLLLTLINKTQEVIDTDDVISMNAAIDSEAQYYIKSKGGITTRTANAIIEVLTSHETINCISVTFGYGQAIVGSSLNQTKEITKENN